MKVIFWLLAAAFPIVAVWLVVRMRRKLQEREQAEAERFAAFMAATAAAKAPVDAVLPASPAASPLPVAPGAAMTGDALSQQKLLFEAAHKAGEAGEAALAIQLYARLLARYPESSFVAQARAAVEAQKKKISKV
jgi:hypothetical protein